MRRLVLAGLLGGLGLVVAGCAQLPQFGSLLLTIVGLPPTVAAGVAVAGPGGFTATIDGTTLLSNLEVGSYSLSSADLTVDHPIVTPTYLVDSVDATVEVTVGTTATSEVTFVSDRGSGHLWLVHPVTTGLVATGYGADMLAAGLGTSRALAASIGANREAIVFDGDGNAWVAAFGNSTIERYAASDLAASGPVDPDIVLGDDGSSSLINPNGLAFDADGNLWVSSFGASRLLRYDASQLTTSGNTTPAVTLSDDGAGSIVGPAGIAFDASGDLWISNFGANTVVRFDSADLVATGSPTPTVTNSSSSFGIPRHLAFDADGNLYVANFGGTNSILKFVAAQLGTSGDVTPTATITGPGTFSPIGLAFDNSGALWTVNIGSLQRFTADQLVTSGAPTPATTITGIPAVAIDLPAFWPTPAGLPIHTP